MNSINDIPNLNKEDTYSTALLLMFVFSRNPRYSTLSELSYILDHENFLKFIKYYEGQTIEVPTVEEISSALKTLLVYQYYVIEEIPWKESIVKAGFLESESYRAQRLLYKFRSTVDEYKVGDVLSGKKS